MDEVCFCKYRTSRSDLRYHALIMKRGLAQLLNPA